MENGKCTCTCGGCHGENVNIEVKIENLVDLRAYAKMSGVPYEELQEALIEVVRDVELGLVKEE